MPVNTDYSFFSFPVRFQYALFLYVTTQILNIKILDAGVNEEDEELVTTLKESKKDLFSRFGFEFEFTLLDENSISAANKSYNNYRQ